MLDKENFAHPKRIEGPEVPKYVEEYLARAIQLAIEHQLKRKYDPKAILKTEIGDVAITIKIGPEDVLFQGVTGVKVSIHVRVEQSLTKFLTVAAHLKHEAKGVAATRSSLDLSRIFN